VATGALTLEVVRRELRRIVAERAETDPNIHYLDGLELFGLDEAHRLPDELHPSSDDYRLIGERFAAHAFAPGGPLAA
jgi:lysophospholipase L1-like esterase